ncbi:MAG: DNA polymerase III subunit epsilon, partial [Burkholderiales bacterium]
REIILDTETTGLDPKQGHRLIEIGCIEVVNFIKTGRVFHTYINPERDVPEDAFRIHGIATEFLKDKPTFHEVNAEFLDFIEDSPLVIHNAGFDIKFINAELASVRKEHIPVKRTIDTLLLARKKFPGAPATLDALCKRFGIDLSKRTKHGALLDADLLADVYMELMGGSQPKMELHMLETNVVRETLIINKSRQKRAPRVFFLKEEELRAHQAFLEKIKNPLWNTNL